MVFVAGLPASGKSTWAKRHFKRVLEFDSFAEMLGSYEDIEEERECICRQFSLLAGSGHYDAVVDVFHLREGRMNATQFCSMPELVIIDTPLEVCLQRNLHRKSYVSNADIVKIAMSVEPVSEDEGFSSIRIVGG